MNWKPILAIVVLLVVAGAILELLVPASGRIIDIAAAVFAVATWIVPPLRLALARKRKTSLAAVGFTVHLFALAVGFSAVGLLLALLTLVFAQSADWAWLAISGVAAFWVLAGLLLYAGSRRAPAARAKGAE